MEEPAPRPNSPSPAHTVADTAVAALEARAGVALLINPKSALLVAANAGGRSLFPAFQSGLPLPLDAAMPAVRDLRGLIASGQSGSKPVRLIFWTARGPMPLPCRVEAAGGDKGAPLFLVAEIGDAAVAGELPQETVKPAARNDEEMLKAIATQIRSAHAPEVAAAPPAIALSAPAAEPEPAAPAAAPVAAPEPPGIDLARLAHELKTPVSAIAAAAEIMKEGRFGEIGNARYAGYISDIHDSARHALALIERMLNRRGEAALSRETSLRSQRLDLVALADGCLSALLPIAEAKGLSLTARHSSPQVMVTADATALRQIVLNLISNAIKFTSEGGAITVETVGKGEKGPGLSVSDTGAGMTAIEIAEALNPERVDIGNHRVGGGLGLGLPLSRALAEAMGASLSITSDIGHGTRVIVRFQSGPLVAI